MATARTQSIQARQAVEVARATLGQFTGIEPSRITVATGGLTQLPAEQAPTALNTAANPIAIEQNGVVEHSRAQLHVLERSYFPRFYLQGSAYARGTGAETDGARLGGVNGLGPNVRDYALGFTVTLPVLDLPSLRRTLRHSPAHYLIPVLRTLDHVILQVEDRVCALPVFRHSLIVEGLERAAES